MSISSEDYQGLKHRPYSVSSRAGWKTDVGCPLCGDESVRRDVATMCDPLLLMVCESSRDDYMEHLRTVHPEEYARESAKEREMNAALNDIFGGKQ